MSDTRAQHSDTVTLFMGMYVRPVGSTEFQLTVRRQTEALASMGALGGCNRSVQFCDLRVALAALMLYDWLLTVDDELDLVWRQKMTVSSWILVMNRAAIIVNGLNFFLGSFSAKVSPNVPAIRSSLMCTLQMSVSPLLSPTVI